jgi:hypothetical protein
MEKKVMMLVWRKGNDETSDKEYKNTQQALYDRAKPKK